MSFSKENRFFVVLMGGCFITGNMVGAGILGLPIKAGIIGFIPSLVGMLLVGLMMFFTATTLKNEAIRTHKEIFHYPSLYKEYFGPVGKWIATIADFIILYGFLTVYLTGATTILTKFLKVPIPRIVVLLTFFTLITSITVFNPKGLLKWNSAFIALLLLSFIAIVFMGEKYVDVSRLTYTNWKLFPTALPIMITAASFHNVIPTISRKLNWNSKNILLSIILGAIIGYFMNAIWIQVGLGVLPLEGENGILYALHNNLPSIIPLAKAIKTPIFMKASLIFALIAIITSYLSGGQALMDFVDDFTSSYLKKRNRILTVSLAFLPPFIVTILCPSIFLQALDVVGGIGIVVLFGIGPSVIALIRLKSVPKRVLLVIPILLLFVAILVFKIRQETGHSLIKPQIDYWTDFTFEHFSPWTRHPILKTLI